MQRDTLFTDAGSLGAFAFDERVAAVFPDMIRRSVPGYETVLAMTGLIGTHHARPGTRCYDLGASLGASSLALAQGLDAARIADCPIIAIDNAPAMLARARAQLGDRARIEWREGDIRESAIENASVVVMNYTLQFLAPDERLAMLQRIRRGLTAEGVLLVSEKIRFESTADQAAFEELHRAFKRAQGYSELEIDRKREALEGVLIAESIETHRARFHAAGFSTVRVWFQCLNWASFLACP